MMLVHRSRAVVLVIAFFVSFVIDVGYSQPTPKPCVKGACKFMERYLELKKASDNGDPKFKNLRDVGEKAMKEFKQLVKIPVSEWGAPTVEDFLSGVKVWEKQMPEYNNGGLPVYRGEITRTDFTPLEVFRGLGQDAAKVASHNPDYDGFEILSNLDGLHRVIWQQVTLKSGFKLPSRDAMLLQRWEFDGNAFYFAYTSIDWPDKPPAAGVTRIHSNPSGFAVFPHKGGIRMVGIANGDLKPPKDSPIELMSIMARYNIVGYVEKFFEYLGREKSKRKS